MSRTRDFDDDHDTSRQFARLASTDLNLLVPLLALLEERNVTRAAERMGLSQPAMSHLLKRTRLVLGDELLARAHGHFSLTPLGSRLIEPLRELLSSTADLLSFPRFEPASDTRTITIAATSTSIHILLPRLIERIAAEAPRMNLALKALGAGEHEDLFVDSKIDVALLPTPLPSPYPRRRLFGDRWVVVSSSSNSALADGVGISHLVELPHIVFNGGAFRTSAYAALDALGLTWRTRATVNDFLLIPPLLVEGGDAIAIMHERVVVDLAGYLPLAIHPLPIEAEPFGVDLLWNPRLGSDPVRQWLYEHFVAAVEALPPLPERTPTAGSTPGRLPVIIQ